MTNKFDIDKFQMEVIQELLNRSEVFAQRASSRITTRELDKSDLTILLQILDQLDNPIRLYMLNRLTIGNQDKQTIRKKLEMQLDEYIELEEHQAEYQQLLEELLRLNPKAQTSIQHNSMRVSQEPPAANLQQLREQHNILSEGKAQEIIARKDVRALLCPALVTVTGDAFEIAKVITPVLAAVAIAGTIAIPLIPALFASIALIISRIGVASLCDEYVKKTLPV